MVRLYQLKSSHSPSSRNLFLHSLRISFEMVASNKAVKGSLVIFVFSYRGVGAFAFSPLPRYAGQSRLRSTQSSATRFYAPNHEVLASSRSRPSTLFDTSMQMTSSTSSKSAGSGDPAPVQDALAGLTVAFSLLSKAIACR